MRLRRQLTDQRSGKHTVLQRSSERVVVDRPACRSLRAKKKKNKAEHQNQPTNQLTDRWSAVVGKSNQIESNRIESSQIIAQTWNQTARRTECLLCFRVLGRQGDETLERKDVVGLKHRHAVRPARERLGTRHAHDGSCRQPSAHNDTSTHTEGERRTAPAAHGNSTLREKGTAELHKNKTLTEQKRNWRAGQ